MTILRPGKRRRDPLGMHECWHCDCQFSVQRDELPSPDAKGGIWLPCPACASLIELNMFVHGTVTEP